MYLAAFKLRWFVLWTSETASQVEELVASMIDEIEGNDALTEDFPHMKPAKDERGNYIKWTDRDLVMESGFRLSARGAQKSTRGLRRGAKRPDLVICDDAEGENTIGDVQYPKVRRWLTRVIAPALAPGGDILWVNTLIDWVSVTGAMIRGDEDWTANWNVHHLQAEWYEAPDGRRVDVDTLTFHEPGTDYHGTAYDGETDALKHCLLWPEYWPKERLEAFLQENGALAYSFEMLNKPRAEGQKVFRDPDWLKWADFEGNHIFRHDKGRDDWINTALLVHVTAIDPAFGGKDYAAVVTVGVFQHDFFVREAWWYKKDDVRTAMVDEAIRQAEYWKSKVIVVESVAAQILLADEFVRKSRTPVQKFHPTKSKVDRALPVAIRASQGHVYFQANGDPKLRTLRELLLQFPGPISDDPVDAFVMAVEGAAELRSKFLVAAG
jgi:phage terminase large subunit-like protein